LAYGLFDPAVIFNFFFGVVTEIAEFHKRCGGKVRNFKESNLYREITSAVRFSRSNCLNADFGTIRPIEAQVLAALVAHLKPRTVFEMGTYTGFSTLHLIENAPLDTVIYTLDLPQDKSDIVLKNDLHEAHRDIKNINLNERRYFHVKEARGRVIELFGDSMTFDFSPYYGKVDLAFIDANHSYLYVKSDTENALRMLSDRGVVLWHDYDFIHPGVFKLINELAQDKQIFYIERTRYALFMNNEQKRGYL
jgi:predicted O-methyltransferase YrrM